MPQTDRVAVVATHIAADRRALSEAWYSALHLAAPARRCAPARGHARPQPIGGASTAVAAARRGCAPGSAPHAAAAGRRADRSEHTAEDRRAPDRALARILARTVARPPHRSPAAFSVLRLAGGRVQVVVRETRGSVHVVALCAPALRERVERALAEARLMLARGTRAEAA